MHGRRLAAHSQVCVVNGFDAGIYVDVSAAVAEPSTESPAVPSAASTIPVPAIVIPSPAATAAILIVSVAVGTFTVRSVSICVAAASAWRKDGTLSI